MAEYIDKDALLAHLQKDPLFPLVDKYGVSGVIQSFPTADVKERKKGKWIGFPECLGYPNSYSREDVVCSECEECFNIIDNCTERFDFCPHCGADMREET